MLKRLYARFLAWQRAGRIDWDVADRAVREWKPTQEQVAAFHARSIEQMGIMH